MQLGEIPSELRQRPGSRPAVASTRAASRRRAGSPAAVALLFCGAIVATGCGSDISEVDNFPVAISRSHGAVTLPVAEGVDGTVVQGVLDTLSPVTVIDPFEAGVVLPSVSRRQSSLLLHSAAADAASAPVPRQLIEAVDVLSLHPCGAATPAPCRIGQDDATEEFAVLVGADTLAKFALRVNFAAAALTLFPDMSGSDVDRSRSCDAVFAAPYFGGGTLLVGGAEIEFTGRRLAMAACLGHTPLASSQIGRGVAAMMLISTSIGPTLLSASSYQRYRGFDPAAPDPSSAAERTVWLPSGPITGAVASLDRLALVAEASTDRGPCRELYANYLLAQDGCATGLATGDCPCTEGATFCRAGAAIELSNDPTSRLEVIVIADDEPVLQALRGELRPRLPEVDGIIGTDALSVLELDLDYPNSRVLARCTSADCAVRPAFFARSDLDDVAACTASATPVLD